MAPPASPLQDISINKQLRFETTSSDATDDELTDTVARQVRDAVQEDRDEVENFTRDVKQQYKPTGSKGPFAATANLHKHLTTNCLLFMGMLGGDCKELQAWQRQKAMVVADDSFPPIDPAQSSKEHKAQLERSIQQKINDETQRFHEQEEQLNQLDILTNEAEEKRKRRAALQEQVKQLQKETEAAEEKLRRATQQKEEKLDRQLRKVEQARHKYTMALEKRQQRDAEKRKKKEELAKAQDIIVLTQQYHAARLEVGPEGKALTCAILPPDGSRQHLVVPGDARIDASRVHLDTEPRTDLRDQMAACSNRPEALVSELEFAEEHRATREAAFAESPFPITAHSSNGVARAVLPNGMEVEFQATCVWPTAGTLRLLDLQAPVVRTPIQPVLERLKADLADAGVDDLAEFLGYIWAAVQIAGLA